MENKNYIIGISSAVAIIVIGVLFLFITHISAKSPDELRNEAAQARIEAMQSDCKTVSKRVQDCFNDNDKSACVTMQESYAWFQGEYKESPDFACSTVPDPLAFGAVSR